MNTHALFVAHEATLCLYRVTAGGSVEATPLWIGACAERIGMRNSLGETRVYGMGARYPTVRQDGGDDHSIEIERLWVIPRSNFADFKPSSDERYMLDILWANDRDEWYRRRYTGIICQSYDLQSDGIMQFSAKQSFWAEDYTQSGGSAPDEPDPPSIPGIEHAVPFFADTYGVEDAVLLGHYRWSSAMRAVWVKARGVSGGSATTTLRLYVDGAASGTTAVLPGGVSGEWVEVESELDLEINALESVRWVVESAPDEASECASQIGLVMRVEPVSESEVPDVCVVCVREAPCVSGVSLAGNYGWPSAMVLASVLARGNASVSEDTEFELFVDDAASGLTITLPSGAGLVESDAGTLAIAVPAGTRLEWRVVSAPADAENCATGVTITMQLNEVGA